MGFFFLFVFNDYRLCAIGRTKVIIATSIILEPRPSVTTIRGEKRMSVIVITTDETRMRRNALIEFEIISSLPPPLRYSVRGVERKRFTSVALTDQFINGIGKKRKWRTVMFFPLFFVSPTGKDGGHEGKSFTRYAIRVRI